VEHDDETCVIISLFTETKRKNEDKLRYFPELPTSNVDRIPGNDN
jgi:hypothetical protein